MLEYLPWVGVSVFGAFFGYAAVHEIRHRKEHGPPENARDAFECDEEAPSYEEPPEPEEDADGPGTDEEGADAPTEDDATDPPARDPDREDKR
ncbi:hypothetical protein [Rhodosalinus sp. FB01]|uniref:hypothetical protein n=1 Tax=Rhodosalinus sp. FB01 TaxID=3239194 RepID=UPI0035259F2A